MAARIPDRIRRTTWILYTAAPPEPPQAPPEGAAAFEIRVVRRERSGIPAAKPEIQADLGRVYSGPRPDGGKSRYSGATVGTPADRGCFTVVAAAASGHLARVLVRDAAPALERRESVPGYIRDRHIPGTQVYPESRVHRDPAIHGSWVFTDWPQVPPI